MTTSPCLNTCKLRKSVVRLAHLAYRILPKFWAHSLLRSVIFNGIFTFYKLCQFLGSKSAYIKKANELDEKIICLHFSLHTFISCESKIQLTHIFRTVTPKLTVHVKAQRHPALCGVPQSTFNAVVTLSLKGQPYSDVSAPCSVFSPWSPNPLTQSGALNTEDMVSSLHNQGAWISEG